MSEASDYAELLRALDEDGDEGVSFSREAAAAIRALEAKVREAEHWNESCEAENRKHILSLREHAQRLEDDRDRLAVELFEVKSEIMRWQSYLDWLLKFASDQHDMHVAEVAALREERTVLAAGLEAVDALIHDSFGVAGLHLNGEVASWESLLEGGEFEAWLSAYCDALVAARKGGR